MAVIALDGRKYFDFGIGTYIQQLVKALSLLGSSHKFVLYVTPSDRNSIAVPAGWSIADASYPKYSLSEIALFGLKVRRDNIDVFHEPHYTLPAFIRNTSIATIHDIIHLRFPGLFNPLQRAYSRAIIWHSLQHSRAVIVDSEFTKKDILRSFRVDPAKINVVPLGVGEQYREAGKKAVLEEFRQRYSLDRPYILYVGNVKPHKGIETLLKAFGQIHRNHELDLVLAGGILGSDRTLSRLAQESGIAGRIRELGRLSDEELVLAYRGAEALVMPSRYEGFGLPALEAMSCGVPVLVSDAGSLPEVVGDAALVFKTGDSKGLAEGLVKLLKEPSTRRAMIRNGKERAKLFTWKQTALKTLEIYEQVIQG